MKNIQRLNLGKCVNIRSTLQCTSNNICFLVALGCLKAAVVELLWIACTYNEYSVDSDFQRKERGHICRYKLVPIR